MDASDTVISLRSVDAGYPGRVVLENLTFDIRRGEIFILLGGSGCGKSTVMKHMIGLNPVVGGKLEILGREWSYRTRPELCRRIGVMYQSGALFGAMTCLENVMLPLELSSRLPAAARRERALERLGEVEMADAAGKFPRELSGGMRKRVAIARALALDPEIVFLDEPGAGLDPITAAALDALILRLRASKKTTFVVVTHELASILRIGDRAAVFDRNRRTLVALGDPRGLKANSSDAFVRQFFNAGGSHG